jgi:hypothetical protein
LARRNGRRQPGFVAKQVWRDRDRPDRLHTVIIRSDEASLKAIPWSELDAVDARMGGWIRQPACRVFAVVSDG